MCRILVGTTSWTEKTLVESGCFYPPDVHTAEARLRFYASRFPVVEVDSSYYGLLTSRNAGLWAERTPDRFAFDVKAFRLFTQHQTPPDALPKDIREGLTMSAKKNLYYKDLPAEILNELWERFRSALDPLRRSGKLGVVLFQFAPWFVYRPWSLELISACAERLPGHRIAVEFRNKSWFGEKHLVETVAFERAHGLIHVVVDEPQGFPSSVPVVWEATSPDLAIVRLHGRNRAAWAKKGISAAERFSYLYSGQELRELAGAMNGLGGHARELHVLFNNCYRDNAQRNALDLQALMNP